MKNVVFGTTTLLVAYALSVSSSFAQGEFAFDALRTPNSTLELMSGDEALPFGFDIEAIEINPDTSLGPRNEQTSGEGAIAYHSPRVLGFRLTGGYALNQQYFGGVTAESLANPFVQPESTSRDVFSVGGSFRESFGDLDVALTGGYNQSYESNSSMTLGLGDDEPDRQFVGGFNLGYQGFRFGGSIGVEDVGDLATSDPTRIWAYDAGASYSTGKWTFGINYYQSESDGLAGLSGENPFVAYQAGVVYRMSPGIQAEFSGIYGTWQDDDGAGNDTVVGIVGLKVGF
jgi:predicted porin